MRKEAQKPVNRCFGSKNCPEPKKSREEQIKELLAEKGDRKRAGKKIKALLKQFHSRYDLVDILPLVARTCLALTLRVLLERIRNTWGKSPRAKQRKILEAIQELSEEEYITKDTKKQEVVAEFLQQFMDLAAKS